MACVSGQKSQTPCALAMASEAVSGEPVLPVKARFCVKCKKHLPVACFMSKDGVHDDTLCNQHEPERNGLRYCRGCQDFVALALFPKGPKQFACRKHMNLYGGVQKSKKKQMENPDTRRRTQQWQRCYADGKKFKLSLPRMGQAAIEVEIRKVDKTGTGNYAVMPINVKTSDEFPKRRCGNARSEDRTVENGRCLRSRRIYTSDYIDLELIQLKKPHIVTCLNIIKQCLGTKCTPTFCLVCHQLLCVARRPALVHRNTKHRAPMHPGFSDSILSKK